MKPWRLIAIAAVTAGLTMLAACSAKPQSLETEGLRESRWSATYTRGGEASPLTLILMSPPSAGPARLVILSAFGAALGDCRLEKGRGRCDGRPGTQGLTRPVSEAVGALLQHDPAFLLNPGQGPGQTGAAAWRAARDQAGQMEIKRESSDEALTMKRMDLK